VVRGCPHRSEADVSLRALNGDLEMITRRTFAALAIVLSTALAVPALASMKFTLDALVEAQKAGKSILVEVTAPWCPVCRAQKVALGDLGKQQRFNSLVKFEVDFDTQKDALKALNAKMQSTLIVMGRLVGDANKQSIEALLAKAL
jgi:thiol-disulfide isomerase/thioredoxin